MQTLAIFSALGIGLIVLLAIIGLVVLFFVWGVGIYNRLVKLKNLVEEAWSGIDVQLKKRYDLIPNLVETVKGYAKHEKETFENVTKARAGAMNAEGVKNQEAAENNLNKALVNLFAVAEQYPDLKANENFLQLQAEITNTEEDIERARRYYNGTARDNNILVQSFPSNIIANMFSFGKADYFELTDEAQREAPKVSF